MCPENKTSCRVSLHYPATFHNAAQFDCSSTIPLAEAAQVFHVDTFLMTSAADLFVCCVLVEIQSLTSYPRGDYVIAKSNELINSSEAF